MFCSKCGKQIPDNTRFCSHCGAQQAVSNNGNPAPNQQGHTSQAAGNQQAAYTAPRPQPQPQPQFQPQKKKKGKGPIIAIVGVVLVVLAIIGKVAAGGGSESDNSASAPASTVTQNTVEPQGTESEPTAEDTTMPTENADYQNIFRDRNIVQAPAFMVGNTAAFAKVNSEGAIENMEFGYNDDDIVTTLVQTIYIDVSGRSQEEKDALDAALLAQYSEAAILDFVEISTNIGTNYYTFTCRTERLDESGNLQKAVDNGLIQITGAGERLSMTVTEESLLSNGYIKK